MKLFDCVSLKNDIPRYNLKKGDIGTIVEIYDISNFEVEFKNNTILTLNKNMLQMLQRISNET